MGYEGGRSGSGGVDKDVEGSDSAAFNPGDIGSRHGRGTVRWTGLPAQPPETVVADGRADRGEDEVWRQARQERFYRLADGDMARCCLAALWLRHDFLDESHTISQSIDTPSGSFWHAIMHRREGDFSNSKYWCRRVGQHPALIGDPFAFVDAVEACVVNGRGDAAELQAQQEREWETLFEYCLRPATDPECRET